MTFLEVPLEADTATDRIDQRADIIDKRTVIKPRDLSDEEDSQLHATMENEPKSKAVSKTSAKGNYNKNKSTNYRSDNNGGFPELTTSSHLETRGSRATTSRLARPLLNILG
jgi:hypothetical protein